MEQKKKVAKIITLEDYVQFECNESNSIVITATQNLRKNKLFVGAKTIVSFADLLSSVQSGINYKESINASELRFLIYKEIENTCSNNDAITYKNCIAQLEELYSKLIIFGVSEISISSINLNNFGVVEKTIINIYENLLIKLKSLNQDIVKVQIIKRISEFIREYDTVIFVGFVFFNDYQESLIRNIENKNLMFVNKKGEFIKNELIAPLLEELDYTIESIEFDNVEKNAFAKIESKLFTDECISIENDKIDFHEPFSNREEEFLFIAKEISNDIKKRNLDLKQIEEAVKDYAIILTKNKNELIKIVNDSLGQYGVFIPETDKTIYTNIKPIYYSKQEFLDDKIFIDNRPLNYVEKVKLFNSFKRIKVLGSTLRLIDFPVGRFIVEIYKVVANGLTIDSFKTLINTHWYLNKTADNEIIEDFYKLEAYFEKLKTIESWGEQIKNLIFLKEELYKEQNFEMHPLHVVKSKTLIYIQEYLEFINMLTSKLKKNASMKQQIQTLIECFGLQNVQLNTQEEKEALDILINSLRDIESNDKIDMDYKFFAEHIKELIEEYANLQEKDKNALRLPVVNMEHYTKFDYVYFPMFEENKYPRILKREFPFTKNIIKLLNALGVGIPKNLDMDYHLKMSRHIFKNVFSFVKKKLTFTYICKENGSDLSISVYAKDIARAINREIKYIDREPKEQENRVERRELIFKKQEINEININELLLRYVCPKLFYYMTSLRDDICYRDTFLLNFYAKALIINKFFVNLANADKEFVLTSDEFNNEIDKIFNSSYVQIMKYFNQFSENEKKDIRITSKKVVCDFIETHFKAGKFATKKARFELGTGKTIEDAFVVKTRNTLIMINTIKGIKTEFDISRNLDFLVSSSNGKKYKLEHFAEIIDQLERGSKFDDKLDLINFASFKVNTQLNNERFFNDGVKRTKALIADTPLEYSNMGECVSGYCRFCKIKNICKGVLIDD